MKTSQRLRFIASILILAALPSCSQAFHKTWHRDLCPAPPPANGVVGKWEGTWLSTVNGHHGKLRCIVSGPTNKQSNHEFFYHATWKSILSGSYQAMHRVHQKGEGYLFKGDHQMPDWAGGKYHYEGTIKGDHFNARYECAKDRGIFTMKRVR